MMAAVGLTVWAPSAEALENNGGYTISDVTVRQRWPWSRKVDIDFYLAKPEGGSSSQAVAIGLVASNGADEVTISDASLDGDYDYMLPEGCRRIVWDPTVDHSGSSFSQLKFFLSVTSTNPVQSYMVADLASGDIQYKGLSFTNQVNADMYKTDKLVLRRITAGNFTMGDAKVAITLTKHFYAGVFEITQRQYEWIMNNRPSAFTNSVYYAMRPVEKVTYDMVRGTSLGTNWPANNSVDPTSFFGILRERTGKLFDLSTEAQWEYACRAGTTTVFNGGDPAAFVSGDSVDEALDPLARYKKNGGYIDGVTIPTYDVSPVNGTAIVGSYRPNAWGLYDMHGNVYEWVLDWNGTLVADTDPAGPSNLDNKHVFRGGCWYLYPVHSRSAARTADFPSYTTYGLGFRVFLTLP